jgi:hypothetical protein
MVSYVEEETDIVLLKRKNRSGQRRCRLQRLFNKEKQFGVNFK